MCQRTHFRNHRGEDPVLTILLMIYLLTNDFEVWWRHGAKQVPGMWWCYRGVEP